MASVSRPALIAALLLTLTGCWTGQLIESARLHESVLTYQRISRVGDELRVEYETVITREPSAKHDASTPTKLRAAAFSIDALAHRPAFPVDEFPLRRVRPGSDIGKPLALRKESTSETDRLVDAKSSSGDMVARLSETEGRHLGFGLCLAGSDDCLGFFHSAALYQDRIAWWAYPIAPLSIALDLALFPIQLFTLPPLIALSD